MALVANPVAKNPFETTQIMGVVMATGGIFLCITVHCGDGQSWEDRRTKGKVELALERCVGRCMREGGIMHLKSTRRRYLREDAGWVASESPLQ